MSDHNQFAVLVQKAQTYPPDQWALMDKYGPMPLERLSQLPFAEQQKGLFWKSEYEKFPPNFHVWRGQQLQRQVKEEWQRLQDRQAYHRGQAAIQQAMVVRGQHQPQQFQPPRRQSPPIQVTLNPVQKAVPPAAPQQPVKASGFQVPQLNQLGPQLYRKAGIKAGKDGTISRLFEPVSKSDIRPGETLFVQPTPGRFDEVATTQPALPISPQTNEPSLLTAFVRRSVGLDQPALNFQSHYHLEAQKQSQVMQSEAARQAALPVSPVSGQPSSLTAFCRQSVGLPR